MAELAMLRVGFRVNVDVIPVMVVLRIGEGRVTLRKSGYVLPGFVSIAIKGDFAHVCDQLSTLLVFIRTALLHGCDVTWR